MRQLYRQPPSQQSGVTAITLVVILLIGAFFILLALKLAPIYLENFKVSSHLQNLTKNADVKNMSDDEIISKLLKRLDIDDVENVKRDDIYIEEDEDAIRVSIVYEVRKPTLGNIDIVASFNEEVAIGR